MKVAVKSKYGEKILNYESHFQNTVFYNKCGHSEDKFHSLDDTSNYTSTMYFGNNLKINGYSRTKPTANGNYMKEDFNVVHCKKMILIQKHKELNNSTKKYKSFRCKGCSRFFKSVVKFKKHSRICRNGNIKCVSMQCLHPNCPQTFVKHDLMLNHLKNFHMTAKLKFTLHFYTYKEFESWTSKILDEFVLIKTLKNVSRNIHYCYYLCQLNACNNYVSILSNETKNDVIGGNEICLGKILVIETVSDIIVKYIPHSHEFKNGIVSYDTFLHNNLSTNNGLRTKEIELLEPNNNSIDQSVHEDVESIKKSVRTCINQLNNYVNGSDVQSLLNIDYILKELLKRHVNSEKKISDDSKISTKENVEAVQEESFTSPLKDADDVNKVIFNVGPYSISLLHLKSLDYNIPAVECAILKSVAPDFRKGWLYDTIIDAFLYNLCEPHINAMFLETAISQIINSNSLNSLRMQLGNKYLVDIEKIFVAFNPNGKHWVLLVVKPKCKKIEIYDPTSKRKAASQLVMKFVKLLICVLLNDFGNNETWNILSPKHIIQKGNYNCGVYICWYAERILNNEDVFSNFSGRDFRQYIFDFIAKNKVTIINNN